MRRAGRLRRKEVRHQARNPRRSALGSRSSAARAREWFSNGVALRLPYRSHSDTDPCVTGIIEAFIVTGGNAPDSSCLAVTPAIDFLEPSGKGC